MRLARGLIAIAVLAPIVGAGLVLTACGVNWFPKCDDTSRPNGGCAPVEPDYPSSKTLDGGLDG